jgi:hypothetical protein
LRVESSVAVSSILAQHPISHILEYRPSAHVHADQHHSAMTPPEDSDHGFPTSGRKSVVRRTPEGDEEDEAHSGLLDGAEVVERDLSLFPTKSLISGHLDVAQTTSTCIHVILVAYTFIMSLSHDHCLQQWSFTSGASPFRLL